MAHRCEGITWKGLELKQRDRSWQDSASPMKAAEVLTRTWWCSSSSATWLLLFSPISSSSRTVDHLRMMGPCRTYRSRVSRQARRAAGLHYLTAPFNHLTSELKIKIKQAGTKKVKNWCQSLTGSTIAISCRMALDCGGNHILNITCYLFFKTNKRSVNAAGKKIQSKRKEFGFLVTRAKKHQPTIKEWMVQGVEEVQFWVGVVRQMTARLPRELHSSLPAGTFPTVSISGAQEVPSFSKRLGFALWIRRAEELYQRPQAWVQMKEGKKKSTACH